MHSMLRGRSCWLAIVAGLAACGAAVPPVPGKGGPPWIEVTSDHFTVWTDADRSSARELIQRMENLRHVIAGVAFPSMAGGRIQVFALRDDGEVSAFAPSSNAAAVAITAQAPLWQPAIMLPVFSNLQVGDRTVAHELTHAVSFGAVHHQPRWLAEGMAKFFETVRLDTDRGAADVGAAPDYRGQPMRMAHLVPISKLFLWRDVSEHETNEYSTAWGLFTYLINVHRDELVHYLQLLHTAGTWRREATPEHAEQLWREAFPSLPLSQIDTELREWLVTGNHIVMHFNVQFHDWPSTERALGDADVYAARGVLAATMAGRIPEARSAASAALAVEPSNVLALLLAARLDRKDITLEQARAMTDAHREDWRAWWFFAHAVASDSGDFAQFASARTTACRLFGQNPALIAPSNLCDDEPARASP